jgi:hypothetical protein
MLFILGGSLLYNNISFGQLSPPTNYIVKATYDEVVESRYTFEEVSNLTSREKLKLREKSTTKQVEKYILPNNERFTKITHVSSEGYQKSWMKVPKTTVITSSETTVYDGRNNILSQIPHSSKYLELASNLNTNPLPSFSPLTQERRGELLRAGYSIVDMIDGSVKISKGTDEVIYNDIALYVEIKKSDKFGNPIFWQRKKFKMLSNGENVPEAFIEKKYSKTETSKTCQEFIKITTFSNYQLTYNTRGYENIDRKNEISIYPNPTQDMVNIEYDRFSEANLLTLTVFDQFGSVKKVTSIQNSGTYSFTINDFEKGFYYIRITDGVKDLRQKLIKN